VAASRARVRAYFPFPLNNTTLVYGCMTVEPLDGDAKPWSGTLMTTWGEQRLQDLPQKFPAWRC
jgi:hypothetical protein